MKVAIDLTALMPKTTGIDTYLTELIRNLAKLDHETQYTIFLNFQDRNRFQNELGENFKVRAICPRPRPARLLFQPRVLNYVPFFLRQNIGFDLIDPKCSRYGFSCGTVITR